MKIDNQLYNDDWENIVPKLPTNSFDLIYIDPPYEMKYISNIPGAKQWNKSGITLSKFNEYIKNDEPGGINWEKLALQCFRTLKKNKYLFLHCNIPLLMKRGSCFTDVGFKYKGCVVWNKKSAIGGDILGRMKNDWEPILYLAKGNPKFNPVKVIRKGVEVERQRISEIMDWEFSIMSQEKRGFPTQKPIELAKQIIELATNKHDIVADFFAGSNTSLLAAKELNRTYFGIELDKEVFTKFKGEL